MTDLTHHPAARLYPPLNEADYNSLEKSILKHGIQTPILTWRGQIIDGAHRHRIATEHDLPLPTTELNPDHNPWTAALAANAARRHLTATERAIIATRATLASQTRSDQLPNTPTSHTTTPTRAKPNELTMAQAAQATGARRQTMSAVRTTLTRGTTATIEALTEAELPADLTAQIARLPKPAQHEALEQAKTARRQPQPKFDIPADHRNRYHHIIAWPPYPTTPTQRPHYQHTATYTATQLAQFELLATAHPQATIAIHAPADHLPTAIQLHHHFTDRTPHIIAHHHQGAPASYWLLTNRPKHLTTKHCHNPDHNKPHNLTAALPTWIFWPNPDCSPPPNTEALLLWPPPTLPIPLPDDPDPTNWLDDLPPRFTHHTPGAKDETWTTTKP